jgi:hypothetical protein
MTNPKPVRGRKGPARQKIDRRAELRAAAAKVHASLDPAFRRMTADEIMAFLRSDQTPAGLL